ncbi:MAG: hypothetical protein COB69_10240 [Phycisphaera sp.]|nr:MAG: hypothetical protein COB69_10240 [Phycisphaera sp.]
MTSALIPATLAVTAIFLAQLVTSWRLFTIVGDPNSWQNLDLARRKPHWYAAFGSLAFGATSVIGAFLLWTLS